MRLADRLEQLDEERGRAPLRLAAADGGAGTPGGGSSGSSSSGGGGMASSAGSSTGSSSIAHSAWTAPKGPAVLPKTPRQCPLAQPVNWGTLPRDPARNRAAVFTPYNIVRPCMDWLICVHYVEPIWLGCGWRQLPASRADAIQAAAAADSRPRNCCTCPQVFGGGERYLLSVVQVMQASGPHEGTRTPAHRPCPRRRSACHCLVPCHTGFKPICSNAPLPRCAGLSPGPARRPWATLWTC